MSFFFISFFLLAAAIGSKMGSRNAPLWLGKIVPAVFLTLLVVFVFARSVKVVDNGEVIVTKTFGKTEDSGFEPGVHLIAPWVNTQVYNTLRREFTFEGEVITNDSNPLEVSVGFATKLNPASAWKLQLLVGEDYFDKVVVPAGQTATRSGIAKFGWEKAATSERSEVEAAIQQDFVKIVVDQLVAAGLSAAEAPGVLHVFPVQLRKSLPDKKVLNAVAEKTASKQDLDRQKTLTDIAAEEAKRRTNEGTGIKNLFDSLPKGFTAEEISKVLTAMASKTRADAMMKAVESGNVDTVIMNGDSAPALAVGRVETIKSPEN